MSDQGFLFAPPPKLSAAERHAALLAQPIEALWGAAPVAKDIAKVRERLGPLRPGDLTLATLESFCEGDAKALITPKRLFLFVADKMKALGLHWRKVEKWPGRKLVTDWWGEEFRQRHEEGYAWDLHQTVNGPAWKSRDHEAAMLLVTGIGPMVLAPGVAFEDGVPDEMERWFDTPADRFEVPHDACQERLYPGTLVVQQDGRWRASEPLREAQRPEAVVVAETEDGFLLDRAQAALCEPVARAAMGAYLDETLAIGGQPTLSGFQNRFAVYIAGVLSQNARVEKGKVYAFPFRFGQKKKTPGDLAAEAERERENEAYYEGIMSQPTLHFVRGGR